MLFHDFTHYIQVSEIGLYTCSLLHCVYHLLEQGWSTILYWISTKRTTTSDVKWYKKSHDIWRRWKSRSYSMFTAYNLHHSMSHQCMNLY